MLEARNAGKPIGDARGEMEMVAQVFDYYAGAPERLLGDSIPVSGGQAFTVREPLGVVGLIVPWNFPLTIAAWKLGPALAAGNTVVLKPAELTPLTALRFADLALEAGLPEGVLNVVAGPGVDLWRAARRAPRRRQDRVHRLDRGRTRDRPDGGGHVEAGDAGTGRQVAEHRVRRRRPCGRRRRGARRGVRQRRPGLLRALADPRAVLGARRVRGAAGRCGRRDPGRRSAGSGDGDGAADLRRAPLTRRLVPGGRRRPAGRDPGVRRRTATGFWFAPAVLSPVASVGARRA